MEQEIDLRPFFRSILSRWWLVLLVALGAALIGVVLALMAPRVPTARADVLIISTTSQVNLDPRFTTRDATLLTNVTFQRQALISLATSSAVEQATAQELVAQGHLATAPAPGTLASTIRVASQGDLVVITAETNEAVDAVTLAETWARAYEQVVAEVYTRDIAGDALLTAQVAEAERRYQAAQAAYETFVGQSELVQVEQQVKRVQELLDAARLSGITLHTEYLLRAQELDLILSDAQALRQQVGGNSDSLADGVALLTLRARAAGGELLPVQLSFADAASVARSSTATLDDLEILITVIAAQRDALLADAADVAASLTDTTGPIRGLGDAPRTGYEAQLATLLERQEALLGERAGLAQSRDVAFSSLEVLRRKADEQQIAQTTPQTTVRFVGATIQPPPSPFLNIGIYAILGGAVGVLSGIALALILDRIRPRARPTATPVPGSEQSVPTRS
jgi:capsular polysaccharide biosynthesis protein